MSEHGIFATTAHRVKRLYHAYYYSLPIPVLSKAETYFLNTVNMVMAAFFLYYLCFILPHFMVQAVESLHYYITGNFLSVKLLLSVAVSRACMSFVKSDNHTETVEM